MGVTAYLAIVCAIAVILDIVLFVYKKKTLGIIILCLLIVGFIYGLYRQCKLYGGKKCLLKAKG